MQKVKLDKDDNWISDKDIITSLVNLRQLTFEVTDACNFKCRYCGYGDMYYGHDDRKGDNMPIEIGLQTIDYLTNIWKSNVPFSHRPLTYISFYGGEPLLNIKFIKELVAYIEKIDVNREFVFSMTTNAYLLDKYMDFLVKKNFHILISLDGDAKANSYRLDKLGKETFNAVTSNIKLLRTEYPDYFDRNVEFNSVLHNRNSVEGINSFIYDTFGKKPTVSELNTSEIKIGMIDEFKRMYQNKSESIRYSDNCERISEDVFLSDPLTYELMLYLHRHCNNVYMDYCDLLYGPNERPCLPTGTCIPFSKKMFVTVHGKILQCERINHKYALGKVSESGVRLNCTEIADSFNKKLSSVSRQCRTCERKQSCMQCIYYIEDIGDKPICKGYTDKERFASYSSMCMEHLCAHPYLYAKLMNDIFIDG